jgi:hypothetical protein
MPADDQSLRGEIRNEVALRWEVASDGVVVWLAVPREKAPQYPIHFGVIYQPHMRGRDMDYFPLKHLSPLGDDQIVTSVN